MTEPPHVLPVPADYRPAILKAENNLKSMVEEHEAVGALWNSCLVMYQNL